MWTGGRVLWQKDHPRVTQSGGRRFFSCSVNRGVVHEEQHIPSDASQDRHQDRTILKHLPIHPSFCLRNVVNGHLLPVDSLQSLGIGQLTHHERHGFFTTHTAGQKKCDSIFGSLPTIAVMFREGQVSL